MAQYLFLGRYLQYASLVEHRQAVAQGVGLSQIVRDQKSGNPNLAMHGQQFVLQPTSNGPVKCSEWLIQEQHVRVRNQGTGYSHPLLLPAGQLVRLAGLQTVQPHQLNHLFNPRALPGAGPPSQTIGNVPSDRKVREKGIVLRHVTHPTLSGRHVDRRRTVEQDVLVQDYVPRLRLQ